MYTSLCIARVFDDHRSCQKLINYITNIKAKSKRYHWIQKIPVLKWLFIQNFCKRIRAFRTFTFSMQQCIVYMTKKIGTILFNFRFQIGNDRQSKSTWEEFFFFFNFFFYKNRNTGFSPRHLIRLQKFCMNSHFRTGIFWIQ
jgi:hypothetical protein